MAYMSQDRKKELAPAIKAVLKKYKVQGTIAVRHHSTLIVNLRKGKLDLLAGQERESYSPNPYCLEKYGCEEVQEFFKELKKAMMTGNYDNSDIMTDYFDVGWYTEINVGKWDKPYIYAP